MNAFFHESEPDGQIRQISYIWKEFWKNPQLTSIIFQFINYPTVYTSDDFLQCIRWYRFNVKLFEHSVTQITRTWRKTRTTFKISITSTSIPCFDLHFVHDYTELIFSGLFKYALSLLLYGSSTVICIGTIGKCKNIWKLECLSIEDPPPACR